jgi:hypothetical protein
MHILSIFIAATAAFVSAALWNGPLFGKTAMRLSGTKPVPPKPWQLIGNYLVFLVTAFVMAGIFWAAFPSGLIGERTWFRGVITAVWLWFGFIVTSTSIDVLWKGKSWKSWLFECASSLVVFMLMGGILGW